MRFVRYTRPIVTILGYIRLWGRRLSNVLTVLCWVIDVVWAQYLICKALPLLNGTVSGVISLQSSYDSLLGYLGIIHPQHD